jgi:hypothetical protein
VRTIFLGIHLLLIAVALPARAQAPSPCDRLAGEEQKRCLQLEEQRRQERESLGREEGERPRKCDSLFGPEKELCLRRGGTVRAGTAPSGATGGSAAQPAR